MKTDALLKEIQASANALPAVSAAAAAAYSDNRLGMTAMVNRLLENRGDLPKLLNGNPVALLHDNHRNHVNFMQNVFLLNEYTMLVRTLPWVYHTYHSRGIPFAYFTVELKSWQESVCAHLSATAAAEINRVYEWMLEVHPQLMQLAADPDPLQTATEEWLIPFQQAFLSTILTGDQQKTRDVVEQARKAGAGLADLYMQMIQPSLHEIGRLWQENRISVAHEHLAAATVSRLMAEIAPSSAGRQHRRLAVVTAAPNEFHEIGPWMIADLLTAAGWDVRYLGANTPADALLSLLRELHPSLLAVSVTMPFNLERAAAVISLCRQTPELRELKIMIGGGALRETADLYQKIGADAIAANAVEAVSTAATLCPEHK